MNVAVLFGGKSSEHDISVLTGMLTINAIKNHTVLPIYIGKDGKWRYSRQFTSVNSLSKKFKEVCLHPFDSNLYSVSGKKLGELDVAIICCHGAYGEDGALAGVLEHSNIPYAPGGVLAGAVGMDKVSQKRIFRDSGIDVLDFVSIDKIDYKKDIYFYSTLLKDMFPVIIKPASLGSSIGIEVAQDFKEFFCAADKAFDYDDRIIVEKALIGFKEYNCAVLGFGDDVIVSQIEQPITQKNFLDYTDKYSYSCGATRVFPAQIDDELKQKIVDTSKKAFKLLKCWGVARIDFLYLDKLYLNEINTVPGSMSSYLFDYDGMNFTALTQKLIDSAYESAKQKSKLSRVFDNFLLNDTKMLK